MARSSVARLSEDRSSWSGRRDQSRSRYDRSPSRWPSSLKAGSRPSMLTSTWIRLPRRLINAAFVATRYSQLPRAARPSKSPILPTSVTKTACTTSSAAALNLGPYLGRDAAARGESAARKRRAREVAGLGTVEGDEEIEGLAAGGVAACERHLADDRARVLALEAGAQPIRRGVPRAGLGEVVDVGEAPGPEEAPPTHVAEPGPKGGQGADLELVG